MLSAQNKRSAALVRLRLVLSEIVKWLHKRILNLLHYSYQQSLKCFIIWSIQTVHLSVRVSRIVSASWLWSLPLCLQILQLLCPFRFPMQFPVLRGPSEVICFHFSCPYFAPLNSNTLEYILFEPAIINGETFFPLFYLHKILTKCLKQGSSMFYFGIGPLSWKGNLFYIKQFIIKKFGGDSENPLGVTDPLCVF